MTPPDTEPLHEAFAQAPRPPADRATLEERALVVEAIHELNNVVGSLVFNQGSLEQDIADRRPHGEMQELSDGMREGIDRLRGLIRALLTEIGKRDLSDISDVDVVRVLEDLVARWPDQVVLRRGRAEVIVRAAPNLLGVALATLIESACRSGAPVEVEVGVGRPDGPFSDGRDVGWVRVRTPSHEPDRAQLEVERRRHFKGGAEARGGETGVSLAVALLHQSLGELHLGAEGAPFDWWDVHLTLAQPPG